MAGFNRSDWEDLNLTREEVENLTEALKKEEFRKLLSEYAEELTDPENRKQYQNDIVQLEAERGVDCTFVNPEPGFVIKTSVDGKKKAFINICKNEAVDRPNFKRDVKDNNRGLSWSIPMCQAPGREDFDKKKNRCVVYDVIFHPNTLQLAEKNAEFKKLVIDTALNAVEDSYKVKLDKTNIKIPKLNYKGLSFATVIRRKSKKQPVLTEEDIEFHNKIKYPFKPPKENNDPVIKNFDNKPKKEKYTIPDYCIKHRSGIEMDQFTHDKLAKLNATIPKELVIEIHLPLLNSTKTVKLDVMKKSVHLICENPVKYKLDIQLSYSVNEERGNATFDKERRLLIITLPVIKAKSCTDLIREDSGIESDSSPVGSISNTEFENVINEKNVTNDQDDVTSLIKEDEGIHHENFRSSAEESEDEKLHSSNDESAEFLDSDKHYVLPKFTCNINDNNVCFVLNVKNVDSSSLVTKTLNSHSCHIKFVSIGSGYFPVFYAFLIDFKDECDIENVVCDTWDNNVTVLVNLIKNDQAITKYYVGLDENSLTENTFDHPLELKKIMDELVSDEKEESEDSQLNINVESADVDEVVISVIPEESENCDASSEKEDEVVASSAPDSSKPVLVTEEKCRTYSESSADEIVSHKLVRKSILKKRICRSLSESNADDYVYSSSVDKAISDGSDLCIHEEHEVPYVKKTVRFNEHIRQQLFRANSSILGRRRKNLKKSRNKKKAQERRLSESENSEQEDKGRDKKPNKPNKRNKSPKNSLIQVVTNKEEKENCDRSEVVSGHNSDNDNKDPLPGEEKRRKEGEEEDSKDGSKPRYGLKKDDKIFEFKSDLIFALDM